jgi:uncharacterized protein (TIGR03086 family)
VAPLSRGLELLEAGLSYALASAALVTPPLLPCTTPCPGWDLAMLLDHVSDSIGVVHEALVTGDAIASPAPLGHPRLEPGPAGRLRGEAARLLGVCAAARPAERRVAIGDRELTSSMVAVTGAIEITVHGWDISAACGAGRPVPPGLATILLPVAQLLIPPDTRPGLFADPVRLAGPARAGDQLVAFLGRQPRPLGRAGPGCA